MMHNRTFGLTLVCVLLISAIRVIATQGETTEKKPPITYCKVANHFARYNHKAFRISGIYRSGGEIMSFYDASCPSADLTAWVDYAPEFRKRSSASLISTMEKLLSADGRVQVDVLAEFDGPKPVTVPAGTPSEIADAMRGTNSRFGHANQFRFRIRFLKILSVDQ